MYFRMSPDQNAWLNSMGMGQFPVGQTQGIPQPGSAPQGPYQNPVPQGGAPPPPQTMAPPSMPQLASFMPQGQGPQAAPGTMPYIQNSSMQQVLGPLMQPNYGNPMVSPYGTQAPGMPQTPGLGGQQMPRPVMQGATSQGLGRWTPVSAASLR